MFLSRNMKLVTLFLFSISMEMTDHKEFADRLYIQYKNMRNMFGSSNCVYSTAERKNVLRFISFQFIHKS